MISAIFNVFVALCDMSGNCQFLVSFTPISPDATVQQCERSAMEQADEWAAKNAPGWVAYRAKCEIVATEGA